MVSWMIERDEQKITMGLHLLPHWYPGVASDHQAEAEGIAEQMDELHLRKIDLADEVFVINWDSYVGESTRKEINYALQHEKPIRYLLNEPEYFEFIKGALVLGALKYKKAGAKSVRG
jgi:hypothetical protein